MRRTMTFSTDSRFVDALDQAVIRVRRANPEAYISRSSFIKAAIRRAMDDLDARSGPEVPVRRREKSVKPVAPVSVA